MKDPQNITIGLLLATAAILAAMLITTYQTTDNAAYADTPVKQGDYILGTGAWTSSTDLVYIVDIAAGRLNVYAKGSKSIDLGDSVDLNQAFAD